MVQAAAWSAREAGGSTKVAVRAGAVCSAKGSAMMAAAAVWQSRVLM